MPEELWELLRFYDIRVRRTWILPRARGHDLFCDLKNSDQVRIRAAECRRAFVRHVGLK